MTYRIVTPIFYKGKLAGVVEIGVEPEIITEKIDKVFDIKTALLTKKYFEDVSVNKEKKKEKKQWLLSRGDELFKKEFDHIDLVKKEFPLKYKNVNYHINTNLDLKDHLGNVAAKLLLAYSVQEQIDKRENLIRDNLIIIISIFVLLFLVLNIGLNFFIRKITKTQAKLRFSNSKLIRKNKELEHLFVLFDIGDPVLFKWKNDDNWSVQYVSSNVEKLFGYTKEEFLNSKVLYGDCVFDDDRARVMDEVEKGSENKDNFFKHDPYRIVTKDGKVKWVLDRTVVDTSPKGRVNHYLGYVIDITEQQELYTNLKRFIDTQDNIVILTDGKELVFANKKFFAFFNYEDIDSFKKEHKCICELFLNNDRFFHLGKIDEDENWIDILPGMPHSQRIVGMLSQALSIHAFSISINDFDENLKIISFTDITQTMLEHIRLEDKTIHDKLTGAYNREYFEQNYQKLIEKYTLDDHYFSLGVMDIDHFKRVNDTYGHDIGDEVLKHFVKIIDKFTREEDILVRWGGEEFVIILKVKSQNDLFKALDHLRKVIEIEIFETVKNVTCSIGATIYKNDEDIYRTIKRADEAVYDAKAAGRNRVQIK